MKILHNHIILGRFVLSNCFSNMTHTVRTPTYTYIGVDIAGFAPAHVATALSVHVATRGRKFVAALAQLTV